MPFQHMRPVLGLTLHESDHLESVCRSTASPVAVARRAFMLLAYSNGASALEIARTLHTNRPVVKQCIGEAIAFGVLAAREPVGRKRKSRAITPEALDWIRRLARESPAELGYRCETSWSMALLARHVRGGCRAAGHPSLARVTYRTLSTLLKGTPAPAAGFL